MFRGTPCILVITLQYNFKFIHFSHALLAGNFCISHRIRGNNSNNYFMRGFRFFEAFLCNEAYLHVSRFKVLNKEYKQFRTKKWCGVPSVSLCAHTAKLLCFIFLGLFKNNLSLKVVFLLNSFYGSHCRIFYFFFSTFLT